MRPEALQVPQSKNYSPSARHFRRVNLLETEAARVLKCEKLLCRCSLRHTVCLLEVDQKDCGYLEIKATRLLDFNKYSANR